MICGLTTKHSILLEEMLVYLLVEIKFDCMIVLHNFEPFFFQKNVEYKLYNNHYKGICYVKLYVMLPIIVARA